MRNGSTDEEKVNLGVLLSEVRELRELLAVSPRS